MAWNHISDSQMYDEIIEIQDKLSLDDWQIGFLESIESEAQDDNLTPPRREQLEKIYKYACDSRW